MKSNPYRDRIQSQQWRQFSRACHDAVGGRCCLFPWLRAERQSVHHLNYTCYREPRLGKKAFRLGREWFWIDALPLSHFAHHHIIHGLLSLGKRPSQQGRGKFPNYFQWTAHQVMRGNAIALVVFAGAWWVLESFKPKSSPKKQAQQRLN